VARSGAKANKRAAAGMPDWVDGNVLKTQARPESPCYLQDGVCGWHSTMPALNIRPNF